MAIKETHRIAIDGTLNTDGEDIIIEMDELGSRNLKEEIAKFNGEMVAITVVLKSEVTE